MFFHFTTFQFQFTVFADIEMKTFLLFVALICATTMATPLPQTTASGEPLSTFLANLKLGLENTLALVNRFENGQSTQTNQSSK